MDEVSVYFAYSEQDKIALSLARIDSKIIRLQDKDWRLDCKIRICILELSGRSARFESSGKIKFQYVSKSELRRMEFKIQSSGGSYSRLRGILDSEELSGSSSIVLVLLFLFFFST